MNEKLLRGKPVADAILAEVKDRIGELVAAGHPRPTLATVLVGDDPASAVYVKKKNVTCERLGLGSRHIHLEATVDADTVRRTLEELNRDQEVHGVLLQLPLPAGLPEFDLLNTIDFRKDVDGFHPANIGRLMLGHSSVQPCTPAGIMELLQRNGIELTGKHAVVVGRSNIVGKPMAMLLLREHCTVTICHSRTRDLPGICRQADILVAAVGRPGLITGDCVREGAVVIDVGVNRVTDPGEITRIAGPDSSQWALLEKKGYALVGDVEWRTVFPKAAAITPVPGGVGPLTIAMLMQNTVTAALKWIKEK